MGIAYSFPMKLFFCYILFKYAHQLIATQEGIQERKETVREAQQEMQQVGQPIAGDEYELDAPPN